MTKLTAEFGNLVCKFGHRDMADLLDEVVLPAFTEPEMVECRGKAYTVDENEARFVGDRAMVSFRVVKHDEFTAEQFGSVTEAGALELQRVTKSAKHFPSSRVMITLADHRIVVCPEVKHGPTLGPVAGVVRALIRNKLDDYIAERAQVELSDLHSRYRKLGGAMRALKSEYKLSVDVRNFINASEFHDSLKRFARVTRLQITIGRTNSELPPSESLRVIREMQQRNERLRSARTTIINQSKADGLAVEPSIQEAVEAAKVADAKVLVRGEDVDGSALRVESDELAVQAVLDDAPTGVRLLKELERKEKAEVIRRYKEPEGLVERIKNALTKRAG